MNKCSMLTLALTLLSTGKVLADEADTLKVVDIEAVTVVAAPKESRKLRELPNAVTLLSQQDLQNAQINSVKNLTAIVPNFYIPDYGSKLSSALYIRGIGSRTNTPSVGLYVDNMPYIDKSAFDFNYFDVERIDILRGPQNTLYGRNAMGGIIKIHTKSPFAYQGTDMRLGAGTHNAYNGSVTRYEQVSKRFAYSLGGFYNYEGGFFRNATRNNERIDKEQSAGGRFRGIYLPSDNWKLDLNVSYEYTDQGAFPYGLYNKTTGKMTQPAYNDKSSYRRNLLNTGLSAEYQGKGFLLSAITGYQYLQDRMLMDQDFTSQDLFALEQRQHINTLSEEIVMRNKSNRRWQWTNGIFGFYQWLKTGAPVTFKEKGVKQIIEENANEAFDNLSASNPHAPQMHMGINSSELYTGENFKTPALSGAIYHQSTFNDLLLKGLSATVGLRLDYEKIWLDYFSASSPLDFDFTLSMPPMSMESKGLEANSLLQGKESTDYVQLLPKFALQYEWQKGNNVYATVSRGYRSGGYNIQTFSDIVTTSLKNGMLDALAVDPKFSSMSAMIGQMKEQLPDINTAMRYKPEYTWNYELGSHLTLWNGRITADLSAFLMDTKDQQLTRFSESGLGRETVNAGKSRSIGAEASLAAAITNRFTLNIGYGYTHATFRDYITNAEINGELQEISYNGNYVPFVPKHTLSLGGQYLFRINPGHWFDRAIVNADYTGTGRIYWTEQNDVSQAFYGTLNGRLSLQKGNGEINFWVRNALDKEYATFYFESMGNGFMQKGRPIQAGIEVRCRF